MGLGERLNGGRDLCDVVAAKRDKGLVIFGFLFFLLLFFLVLFFESGSETVGWPPCTLVSSNNETGISSSFNRLECYCGVKPKQTEPSCSPPSLSSSFPPSSSFLLLLLLASPFSYSHHYCYFLMLIIICGRCKKVGLSRRLMRSEQRGCCIPP